MKMKQENVDNYSTYFIFIYIFIPFGWFSSLN